MATTLVALLVDEFGTDAFAWEPETIRLQLRDVYGVDVPQVNMDKLLGLITALKTNLFYIDIDAFTHITNALNDSRSDFNTFDPVDPDEAAWAVTEVLLNDPPAPEENVNDRFSPEIRKYIGAILDQDKILQPPDQLAMAIMPPAPVADAEETFADDPIIYTTFYKMSQKKLQDVLQYVRNRSLVLINQLQDVPLQNRDRKRWQPFLERALRGVGR